MKRTDRQQLKRKYKRLNWIAFGLVAFFALEVVLLITINWRPKVITEGNDLSMIVTMTLLGMLMFPLGVALWLSMRGSWAMNSLNRELGRLKRNQNKFHAGLFWEAILSADYDEARRLYNLDKFITGSFRVLCNGIIMGCAMISGHDAKWNETAAVRMEEFLMEEDE